MFKKVVVPSERGYHHGNLRQALLDAALALVESGEKRGISLRTAATRAGVSSAAPYRHFQDREALLAAVATIGFSRLLEVQMQARKNAEGSSQLLVMAQAYLDFASGNKGLYQLMFTENHLAIHYDVALAKASSAAFATLEDAVRGALEVRGGGDAKLHATALWASWHGVAMLAFEHFIPAGGSSYEGEAQEVSAAVVRLTIENILGKL